MIEWNKLETLTIFLTALWLQMLNLLFIYSGGLSAVQMQILNLLELPVLFILSYSNVKDKKINQSIMFLMGLMLILFLLTIFKSSSFSVLAKSLNFLYINIMVFLLITKIKSFYQRLMSMYAYIGIIVLIILIFSLGNIDNRASLIVQPNFIGMVALSIVFASLYVESTLISMIVYALSITIVLIVSSRASLLGIIIIIFFELFYFKKIAYLGIKNMLLRGAIFFLYISSMVIYGYSVIANMFLLNDSYRGINSGMSGRTERWLYALYQWLHHDFWLGIGYGESIHYLGFSADNAYITILVELGFIGLVLYMFILFFSIHTAFKKRYFKDILFLVIYMVYGIFEKRYFSVGNAYSMMLFFTIYHIFLYDQKRKDI